MRPRARGRTVAALALALAGCGADDPCADVAGTCLTLQVESATVATIDQLEVDLLYGDRHATTTTQTGGGGVALPLTTAIVLDVPGTTALRVGVVAAGKLGGAVQGTGAGVATLAPGAHGTLTLELAPPAGCEAGGLYCGGDKLAGDPQTLYQCNGGGVPLARGRCPGACEVRPTTDDTCAGVGGTCVDGGRYCGGDKLDGDPQTLYTCQAGVGTSPVVCADGCVVGPPGTDDACR